MNDITNDLMQNKREIEALKSRQALPSGALKLFTYNITFDLSQYNDYIIRDAIVCFQSNDGTTPIVNWGFTTQEHSVPWYLPNKIYDKPTSSNRLYAGQNNKTYLVVSFGYPVEGTTAPSVTITFNVQVTSTVEGVLSVEFE